MKQGDRGLKVQILQKFLKIGADGIWGPKTTFAVKQWQKSVGLVDDGIIGPMSWSKLLGVGISKSKRTISEVILHCTASKEGKEYTVKQITEDHKKRGFSTIGYHYVIYADGSIWAGRDVNSAGAHCTNHNANSIGIVYVGGLDSKGKAKDTRTSEQKASLELLLACMKDLYPTVKILGHRDTSDDANGNGVIDPWERVKECPCFDVKIEYPF